MNGGILQQIVDEKAWEAFLAHRLMKGRFNWRSFQEADTYVGEHLYIPEAERIADGESLGIPERIVVSHSSPEHPRSVCDHPHVTQVVPGEVFILGSIVGLTDFFYLFVLSCYCFFSKV